MFVTLLPLGALPAANNTIDAPQASYVSVMVDGKIEPREWKDAALIAAGPTTLKFVQSDDYVFIAVHNPDKTRAYVDIYLTTGSGQIVNLHASMQIGERELVGEKWSDSSPSFSFGNNVGWIANEAKLNSGKDNNLPMELRLFPYDGYEFQISKERFDTRKWKMRIEIRDFAGKLPDVVFPANSDRHDTGKWATLRLKSMEDFSCGSRNKGWKLAEAVTPDVVPPCYTGSSGRCAVGFEYVAGTGWCRPRG